jgi:type IV pilus assembly protein PilW
MNEQRTLLCPTRRCRQRGYTLIEILVALLIGLFLLGGLFTLEWGTRRASANQTALAQLQDNQRFAMSLLNDVIQAAGYYPNPTLYTALAALPAAGAAFPTAGQPITGTHTSATVPDSITVRYMTASNDTTINCLGGTNTTGGTLLYTNQFIVNTATNQLQCSLNGGTFTPLVNGVTNLQILYGVNTSGSTTTHNVDTYKTATQMAPTDWLNVTAVQVTLSFQNPLYGQPGQTQAAQKNVTFARVIGVMNQMGATT